MTDNNEPRDFWEVVESYEKKTGIIVAILGLIATIVAFLKTPYGPYVFPLVILIFVAGYAFWKALVHKPIIPTPYPRREPWRNRLRKVPWWGWGSLAAILLLILLWGGPWVYTQLKQLVKPPQPSDRFIILIANFHQLDTITDPNAMTSMTYALIDNLRAELADDPKTEVVFLAQCIDERQPDFAHNIGAERKATIVIWGCYAITPVTADFWAHFEVLRKPAQLPIEFGRPEVGMKIRGSREEWESFALHDQAVSELTYLTMFTLGLARYEVGDVEDAIAHFSSALAQVGENPIRMVPLRRYVVYFHRGNARYDKQNYDQAIRDFDKAIELRSDYAAAYNNRGSAYYAKGDYDRAIADWNKGTQLQKLPAVY